MNGYTHRRGSIFWALTLIAVGGIFLYHNFNPAVRPWHIIATFWPILIIFWGLSKLIDYFHARAHPEQVAPPLFSVSEVILLVLILIMGTLLSKIVLRPWQEWPAAVGIDVDEDFGDLFLEPHTYTETLTQPVKAPVRLLVVNRRGDVEIHGADQNSIEAVVKKTVRAPNEEAAKKLADQVKIEIVEQAGRYLLKSNLDSLPQDGRGVRLDLVLRVPKATATEVNAERGDTVVEGLNGNQTLNAQRGDVRAMNVAGLIRVRQSRGDTSVHDVKGSVEVEGRGGDVEVMNVTGTVAVNGDFSGAVQFHNVAQSARFVSSRTNLNVQKLSGRLYMERGSLDATGVDGPFEITTRQKDIRIHDFRHSLKIVNTNGEVSLSTSAPPTQPVEVDLKKGGIDLTLPEKSNFQLQASSRDGEVECDFTGPGLVVSKEGGTPTVSGTYGKGGPMIRLATTYGTIRVGHEGFGRTEPQETKPFTHPAPPQPPAEPAPAVPGSEEKSSSLKSRTSRHMVRMELGRAHTPWPHDFVRAVVHINSYLVKKISRPALDWMHGCQRQPKQIAQIM